MLPGPYSAFEEPSPRYEVSPQVTRIVRIPRRCALLRSAPSPSPHPPAAGFVRIADYGEEPNDETGNGQHPHDSADIISFACGDEEAIVRDLRRRARLVINTSLSGRLRNTMLPKSHGLLPL